MSDRSGVGGQKVRFIQLDILRAVAIFLVLGRHWVVPPEEAGGLRPVALLWQQFGWTGVDLFFVLSGFLIGGLLYSELLHTSSLCVRRFLIRRCFKIWPSYYALIAYLLIRSYFGEPLALGDNGTLFSKLMCLGPHLLHLQNYFGPVRLHTWSLAVEEHFYLVLPGLLLILSWCRRGICGAPTFPAMAVLAAVVFPTCIMLRLHGDHTIPIDLTARLVPTHLRIDSLFFGVCLAYLYCMRPDWFARLRVYRSALLAAGLAMVSPMLWLPLATSVFVSTWGYQFLYLGYGCLIAAMLTFDNTSPRFERVSRSMPARVLSFVGCSSYSIYVWHWHLARIPLQDAAARFSMPGMPASLRWLILTGIYMVLAILVGYVLGRLIERPALQLRDRLFPAAIDGGIPPRWFTNRAAGE